MATFEIDCELDYDVLACTDFLFHVEAVQDPTQEILSETLTIEPALAMRRFTDRATGNRYFRLRKEEPGPMRLRYQAIVSLYPKAADESAGEVEIGDLPDETLQYLMATRYCESDLLERTALRTFGQIPRGYRRVRAIAEWIRENISYEIGSSNWTTTARDVLVARAGVCRDFAHLGIAFCRALNIPARLVVGYTVFDEPPPDFHAIFEAWVGGSWHLFDPTGLAPPERLVRIGSGRDAKDVAFATLFGQATGTRVNPEIREVPGPTASGQGAAWKPTPEATVAAG